MTTVDTTPARSGFRVVDEGEWDACVTRLGASGAYSSAAYHRASALLEPEGTRPVLLAFSDEVGDVALPLLLRPLPNGEGWDATSAYGYGGPIGRDAPNLAAFGAALDEWANEQGVVSTFLRLNPLLDNGRFLPPTAELVDVGLTVGWNLHPGRDLRLGMHGDRLRGVRRAERAGVSVTVTPRPSNLDNMRALYEATMQRQQAADMYFFPESYWRALAAQDELLVTLLVEAWLGESVVCAQLCLVSDDWLHSHLVGGNEVSRAVNASTACHLAAAEWGQANKLVGFHLGGGLGGREDSPLYVFKQRFDPESQPRRFQIAKLVHNRHRYVQLAGTESTEGFFPPWRRPR